MVNNFAFTWIIMCHGKFMVIVVVVVFALFPPLTDIRYCLHMIQHLGRTLVETVKCRFTHVSPCF